MYAFMSGVFSIAECFVDLDINQGGGWRWGREGEKRHTTVIE